MRTKIHLGDKAYLLQDEHCYMPHYFKKGGELVRVVKTGEMVESKDQYIHTGTYHVELKSAIRELAKYDVLSKEEHNSLKDYVDSFNNAYIFLEKQLK